MSDRAREVIAEVLNSIPPDLRPTVIVNRERAAKILAALEAAGIALVELPDEMQPGRNVVEVLHGLPMWASGDAWTCLTAPDCIEYEAAGQTEYGTLTIAEARALAAALLAAANRAEKP